MSRDFCCHTQKPVTKTKKLYISTFELTLSKELESLKLLFGTDVEVLKLKELGKRIEINLLLLLSNTY